MAPKSNLGGVALLGLTLFGFAPLSAMSHEAAQAHPAPQEIHCDLDLSKPGKMSDIVSNALTLGLSQPESQVRAYLDAAAPKAATGAELLESAAKHFSISKETLTAEVEKYRHCNCTHPPLVEGQITARSNNGGGDEVLEYSDPTQFAKDVTLHVVLHELAHALVREFDLPVLANEESLADAFATHYLTTYLPDRAFDVIRARTQSLMIEAAEVPRAEWSVNGEHNSDARRAFQIAAIAVAADPNKYRPIALEVGMNENDIRKAADYGTEIHRSWRRLLRDYRMPEGMTSNESRLRIDEESPFIEALTQGGLAEECRAAVSSFDWHSTVTISFVNGRGGASWSRSKRTITVNSEYVQRFVTQGETASKSTTEPR